MKNPIKEATTSIIKSGISAWFDELTGQPNANPKTVTAYIGQQVKNTAQEGLRDALNDPNIQKQGKEVVKGVLNDGVNTIKQNLSNIVADTEEAVNKDLPSKTTYERAKDLLSYSPTDKWYTKLMKSVGARILSFTVPVLGYIGSVLASRFSNEPNKRGNYQASFQNVMSGLMGQASKLK